MLIKGVISALQKEEMLTIQARGILYTCTYTSMIILKASCVRCLDNWPPISIKRKKNSKRQYSLKILKRRVIQSRGKSLDKKSLTHWNHTVSSKKRPGFFDSAQPEAIHQLLIDEIEHVINNMINKQRLYNSVEPLSHRVEMAYLHTCGKNYFIFQQAVVFL